MSQPGFWPTGPKYAKPRRFAKCAVCEHRFLVRFENQRLCFPCADDYRRVAKSRVQPDLPLEGDARGD